MKKRILVVLLVLLLGSFYVSNEAFAAWTQAKGHSYNQLTLQYYVNDHKWTSIQYDVSASGDLIIGVDDQHVHKIRTSKFETISTTYYGEYGIIDSLTVFTAIPWKKVSSDDTRQFSESSSQAGLGDIDLGLRYNLTNNLFGTGVVMSIQVTEKIPEAYTYGDPLLDLSLGDGQYDTTAVLQLGTGLGGKGYTWMNAGYKWRHENHKYYHFKPSDQIRVTFGGGYSLTSWFSLRGLIDYTRAVGNATISENFRRWGMLQGQTEDRNKDNILIRDSMGLEPVTLHFGTDIAINLSDKIQTVVSYGRDIGGPGWADWLQAKDSGMGESFSLALVYMW